MDDETRIKKIIEKVERNGLDTTYIETAWYLSKELVLNPKVLKAYFGEELVCSQCGTKPIILVPKQCAPNRLPCCPNCLHSFTTKIFPPNLVPAYIYHAHKILDLILDGKNPLVYFEEEEA